MTTSNSPQPSSETWKGAESTTLVGLLKSVLRVQGSGFRVQGSGFRVQGLGFRV
jgi:hypothetical protein